ncbi:hypothetical protein PM082_016118 [Marasmius tenuissimus]|nr:hypothetical protein PM082_016118 [Marasmius tenuissimus]
MKLLSFSIFALLISIVYSQTQTTTDANGQSIIIVVSTVQGAPTTRIVSTLAPATTQQQGQQGPVGQPPTSSGTPHLPIPYEYTTFINGQKTVLHDTFTPTLGFPTTTVLPQIPTTGGVMEYSEWLSHYAATNTNAAAIPLRMPNNGMLIITMMAASTVVCWMSGFWLLTS